MIDHAGRLREAGAVDRFWTKVDKSGDCWLWLGWAVEGGYGKFNVTLAGRDVKVAAHRAAYELLVGPIPEGLVLDHLCRNPPCVNPAHLEPVTNRENVARGVGPSARNRTATECLAGHPFDEENTYVHPATGFRYCRTCTKKWRRESARKRRAERPEIRERQAARWQRTYPVLKAAAAALGMPIRGYLDEHGSSVRVAQQHIDAAACGRELEAEREIARSS